MTVLTRSVLFLSILAAVCGFTYIVPAFAQTQSSDQYGLVPADQTMSSSSTPGATSSTAAGLTDDGQTTLPANNTSNAFSTTPPWVFVLVIVFLGLVIASYFMRQDKKSKYNNVYR